MLAIALVAAGLLAASALLVNRLSKPASLSEPPPLKLAGADPEVLKALEGGYAAVRRSPDSAAVWGDLAMLLLAHEFLPEARVCFMQAAARDGADPRWPYLEGVTLLKGNPDPGGALACLESAVRLCGGEPVPRLRLGEAFLELGRAGEAEAQFRDVLGVDPENPRAHLGLGRLAHSRGDLKTALDHFNRSAAKAPNVKATHSFLAEILHRLGDRDAAERERRLLARLPDVYNWPDPYYGQVLARWVGVMARIERAHDLLGRGQKEEAVRLMRQTVADHPGSLLAHLVLGRTLLELGDVAAALGALEKAVELAPDAFEAQYELGTALQRLEKYPEAAECYRKTLAIKPSYPPAHYNLAHCLLRFGDEASALDGFGAAVRFKPDYAQAQRDLGHMLARRGRLAEARVHLEHAVELNPGDQAAKSLLEQVRGQAGEPRK